MRGKPNALPWVIALTLQLVDPSRITLAAAVTDGPSRSFGADTEAMSDFLPGMGSETPTEQIGSEPNGGDSVRDAIETVTRTNQTLTDFMSPAPPICGEIPPPSVALPYYEPYSPERMARALWNGEPMPNDLPDDKRRALGKDILVVLPKDRCKPGWIYFGDIKCPALGRGLTLDWKPFGAQPYNSPKKSKYREGTYPDGKKCYYLDESRTNGATPTRSSTTWLDGTREAAGYGPRNIGCIKDVKGSHRTAIRIHSDKASFLERGWDKIKSTFAWLRSKVTGGLRTPKDGKKDEVNEVTPEEIEKGASQSGYQRAVLKQRAFLSQQEEKVPSDFMNKKPFYKRNTQGCVKVDGTGPASCQVLINQWMLDNGAYSPNCWADPKNPLKIKIEESDAI